MIKASISSSPPVSFHPHDSGSEIIANYVNQLFETLTFIDVDGSLKPLLSTEWKCVDEKAFLFELRKNVLFHNGERFDADAVVFTFKQFLDPKEKVDNRFYWGPVRSVKKVGDYKVLIRLSHPDSLFPYRLATVGHILPPSYYKKVGREQFAKRPVGTGPFTFAGYSSGGQLQYWANDNYWAGRPSVDGLEFHFFATADSAVEKLLTNELDFVAMIPGHYTLKLAESKKLSFVKMVSHNSAVIMLNTKKPGILQNLLVRKALRAGLNISDVINYGYSGNGRVAEALTHPGETFHPANLPRHTFDAAEAKQMLKRSNEDLHQVIRMKVTEPLGMVGNIIAAQMKTLGLHTKVEHISGEGEKEVVLYVNQRGDIPDVDMLVTFCSHRYANGSFPMLILMHSKGTWGLSNDQTLDDLLNMASTAMTTEEQIKYFQSASKYIEENNLILPGFQIGQLYGFRNDLLYRPHVTGYIYFKNLRSNDFL